MSDEMMSNDTMALTRRDCLISGGLALGALALTAARSDTQAAPRALRARLSLNENPFGPSPRALQAIREPSDELCRYADAEADVLTPAIVSLEDVSADQIVLGEILEALGLHLASDGPAGGEFIYSEPGYGALINAARPAGGVVVGVPLNARLENDLAAIAAKVTSKTRAIYLVNPHNPSGTVSEATTFTAFVRDMSKRTTVIVDEAYLEFEPDFAQRTVAALTRAGENVIVFRTFGKLYALAGLNVGYALAPKPLAASLKRAGIGTPETLTRPALAAAAASLQDQDYVAATRAKVVEEREMASAVRRTEAAPHRRAGKLRVLRNRPAASRGRHRAARQGHRYRSRPSAARPLGPHLDRLASGERERARRGRRTAGLSRRACGFAN
jgi:histidinol-phosphate aminotransferase